MEPLIEEIELISGFQVVEDELENRMSVLDEKRARDQEACILGENIIIFEEFYRRYEKFTLVNLAALRLLTVSHDAKVDEESFILS